MIGSNYHNVALERREVLRFGLGGLSALSLSGLMQARSQASEGDSTRAPTAIILVWLPGGHSHLETYDPKPKVPGTTPPAGPERIA